MHAVNPKLNAVVIDLTEEAIEASRAADERQSKNDDLGPLHGVPLTIKGNVDVHEKPHSTGVPALANLIAPSDAPVVRNLRMAGAIILGITNTPEFSFRGFTDNPLYGLTLNPWNENVTCGGSSGGAAVAVAAGIGAIAHGNDIAGSLRWPAHCNGIVTIKPTHGRIASFNESAGAERPLLGQLMAAQGPLTRHVADARLALRVMSQRDARDPWWVPAPFDGPKPLEPIRVAVAKLPGDLKVAPAILRTLALAADLLRDAGYSVSEVEVPDINGVWQTWCDILFNEASVMLESAMMAVGSQDLKIAWTGMKANARTLDLPLFMEAMARRNTHARAWQIFLDSYPLVLAPTTVNLTHGPREDAICAERAAELFRDDLRFISALNILGIPSAVVPVALHEDKPIGVQLIAGRFREDLALDAAEAIESRAGTFSAELWKRMQAPEEAMPSHE
jgi:amidase